MRLLRKISAFLILSCVIFNIVSTALASEIEQPLSADTYGCHTLDANTAFLGVEKLVDNVTAAVLYELNSDTLMYSLRADEKVYPSSLVKILTALIAVEKGDLQAEITVSQNVLDAVPYYAASAELQPDEQISLSDLLYCMMVGSANDAAAVIATHISGSLEAFVKEMNAYAANLGCSGTQFTNVHGLHDEQQYTTARDMARIVAAAVRNESFLTYFSTVNYIVPATNKSEERELSSRNFLISTDEFQIYFDPRAVGGRTGTTEDGARCLATLAESGEMRVISIVMGSESTFTDDGNTLTYGSFKETSTLLDACFNGYQVSQVTCKGQILKQNSVINGENDVVLCSNGSVYAVLPADTKLSDLTFKFADSLDGLEAPIEAGQILSNAEIWHGGFCIAKVDLVATNSVRRIAEQSTPGEQENTTRGVGQAFIIIFAIFGAVACFLLLIRSVRMVRFSLAKHRSKQYRRSRRRSR